MEEKPKTFKIQRLTIENFMRIKAVNIKPDGNAIVISGKNGAGKSSVLDSIMAALCGKKACPAMPVRSGAEVARVSVDVGDFTVTRKWTGGKDSLTVKRKADGKTASSPQGMLNSLIGEFADNPLKLVTECDPKKQRTILMELAGLDFSDIDKQIEDVKTERSTILSKKKDAEHEAERITFTDDLPDTEISMKSLVDKMTAAQTQNAEIQQKKNAYMQINGQKQQAEGDLEALNEKTDMIQGQIQSLEKQLADYMTLKEKVLLKLTDFDKQLEAGACKDEMADTEAIQAEMDKLEATNKAIRDNCQKKTFRKIAEQHAEQYSKLLSKMKALEASKAKRLADADFPVKGLSVSEDGVLFDGIPLEQVNTAKQLEVCIAVAIKRNPKLRVLRMNGNDLDSDSLRVVEAIAKENDFQVWIERIEGGDDAFVIEDGSLAGSEPVGATATPAEPSSDEGQEDLPFV